MLVLIPLIGLLERFAVQHEEYRDPRDDGPYQRLHEYPWIAFKEGELENWDNVPMCAEPFFDWPPEDPRNFVPTAYEVDGIYPTAAYPRGNEVDVESLRFRIKINGGWFYEVWFL
jgi:hypothetical protein